MSTYRYRATGDRWRLPGERVTLIQEYREEKGTRKVLSELFSQAGSLVLWKGCGPREKG